MMFLLLAVIGPAHAHEELQNAWVRGIFTGRSPRPVRLPASEAWQQAGAIAQQAPGGFVLVGSGASMQPLYQPGTILVLQPLPYENLQSGQTALYRNKSGKVVAHVLVTKARDGWRATGLNNRIHDLEPVLATNLIGVVIGAYRPLATTPSQPATYALR